MSHSHRSRCWPRGGLSDTDKDSSALHLPDNGEVLSKMSSSVKVDDHRYSVACRFEPVAKPTQSTKIDGLSSNTYGILRDNANDTSPDPRPLGPAATQRLNREQPQPVNIGTQDNSWRINVASARRKIPAEKIRVSHQWPPRERRVGDHGKVLLRGEHEQREGSGPEVVEVVSLRRVAAHLHSCRPYRPVESTDGSMNSKRSLVNTYDQPRHQGGLQSRSKGDKHATGTLV